MSGERVVFAHRRSPARVTVEAAPHGEVSESPQRPSPFTAAT